jgi:hypothetical protein
VVRGHHAHPAAVPRSRPGVVSVTAPAMPSPARVVSSSLAALARKGYPRDQARKVIKDVVEALAADKQQYEPWAVAWLRRIWVEANGTGSNPPARTIAPSRQ